MLTCLGVNDKTIQSILDSVPEVDRLGMLLYAFHLQLTGKKYSIVLDDAIKEGDDADQKKKKRVMMVLRRVMMLTKKKKKRRRVMCSRKGLAKFISCFL